LHYRPTYILSLIPDSQSLDDPAYLNQKDNQFNFHRLALEQEFRLHHRDHALAHTAPVIFVRDDAY